MKNGHLFCNSRYNEAFLVHGDLSEYNILYYESEVYFIDVSQSVEHDHPASFDFLRKDCENITNWFFKKGVGAVMTLRELFDFVTDRAIMKETMEEYLEKMMDVCMGRPAPTPKEMVAAEVFKTAFIPQKLADIEHFEVNFQWKNPDFLLKSPDFLIRNPDFLF